MPLFRDRSDRPGLPAEAATGETTVATGAMTGRPGTATGKTVAAAGPGYSGDRELDDQAGHACQQRSAPALGRVPDCLAARRGLWAPWDGSYGTACRR